MFKKIMTTALLACTIPALACAWTFTTQVTSGGGTIDSRNKTGQVLADGAIYKAYSTHANMDYTVTAPAGYSIGSVTLDSLVVTAPASPYTASFVGSSLNKTLKTRFVANAVAVGSIMTGGTASPLSVGNIYTGTKLLTALTFSFVPKSGYAIQALTLGGANASASGTVGGYAIAVTGATGVVNGSMRVTFAAGTVISAPIALVATATTSTQTASAGLSQSALVGATVTLAGTVTPAAPVATYVWTQIGGPDTVTLTPAGNTATFTAPATVGRYTFKVAINGATALPGISNVNVDVVASMMDAAQSQCQFCHTDNSVGSPDITTNWGASVHAANGAMCYDCHYGANNGAHPGTVQCASCHTGATPPTLAVSESICSGCHSGAGIHGFAAVAPPFGCTPCHSTGETTRAAHIALSNSGCIGCHAVAVNAGTSHAAASDGVRGITGATGEFGGNPIKRSHHIVNSDGGDPTNAQCLGCHAEGKLVNGEVVVDSNFHMVSNTIYLRNGGGIPAAQLAKELGGNKSVTTAGVSVFPWNPATPDHNLMDQFCFSCHNANGAPAVVGLVSGNSAGNPFGDTISNGYDQMARGRVVNAFGQFSTGNASHHAVRGQRYTGNSRRTTGAVAGARQIANPATFANTSSAAFNGVAYEAGKTGVGQRKTLFDAGYFTTTYVPLGYGTTLGDDSTLHCGDCHTVGQWTNTNTKFNKAAIGAHGSVNEYMLRNSAGTDALHNAGGTFAGDIPIATDINTVPSLVCYNCHAFNKYGAAGKHEGVNSGLDCNGDIWTNSAAGKIGSDRLQRDLTALNSNGEGSNMFAIQCANCHNSGSAAKFGGIHGGNIEYVDGTGTTQKPYRFLPGLGNVKYAPNNHLRNDGVLTFSKSQAETDAINAAKGTNTPELTNTWEEKTIFTGSRATCYTLNENPANGAGNVSPANGMKNAATDSFAPNQPVLGTWGACSDHGGSSIAGGHGGPRTVQRPLTY